MTTTAAATNRDPHLPNADPIFFLVTPYMRVHIYSPPTLTLTTLPNFTTFPSS